MAFAKLLSGRVAKVTGSDLDSDRSEYISLGNAEPDFGLPDSDNGILSSLSNGTRQFLYPGTGIAIDSGDIDVDVTTTTFNSSGFNHTSSTDLYNVIKDLDQVIGQVTGTDSGGGGAASVLTDSSIDGNGTTGSPLSLHPNVTGLTLLTVDNLKLDGNTLSSTDGSNTLYIDPAPVNDNGGTLVVKGNLQVDGTTTTVNSTTVSINDKNIVLADSAANATEADGAGITVNGANATITYNSTYDAWKLNKDLRLDDNISAYFGNGADLRIYHDGNNSRIREQGSGELRLEYSQLRLWDTSGVTNLVAYSGGGVNLYHNGSQKFGTTGDGVEIPHGQLILGDDSATVDWRIGNGSNDRLIFTIQGTGGPEMELRNDSAANYQDASLYVGGNRVLTTADPGSGNALDADTVDGLHASQFLRSDSDDTATGRIHLSGGAGIGSADNASFDLYNNGTTYLNGTTTIDANLIVSGTGSKVGIGTSNPTESLHISNAMSSSPSYIYMQQTGTNTVGGGAGIIFDTSATDGNTNSFNAKIEGIRSSSNDGSSELRFFTSKSSVNSGVSDQKMVIDEDGYVGIGTTSPTQKLEVQGTILVNNEIQFVDANARIYRSVNDLKIRAGGTDRVTVQSGGNVGIGTTDPATLLQIKKADDTVANILSNGSYSASFVSTTSGSASDATGIFLSGSSGTNRGGAILAEAQSTGNDHDLIFATSASSATPSERMRIQSDGRVGIGTTSPARDLEVQGANPTVRVSANTNNWAAFEVQSGVTQSGYIFFRDSGGERARLQSTDTNDFRVYTGGGSVLGLYQASDGDVGIGTTSPGAKLDVRAPDAGPSLRIGRDDISSYWNFGHAGSDLRIYNTATSGSDVLIGVNNGSGINNNRLGIQQPNPTAPLHVGGDAVIDSDLTAEGTIRSNDAVRLTNTGQFTDNTATTTSTTQTVIAQWSATTFGGAKVIVEAKDGSNRHISELLITHDGTTASATEYGTVHTSGSLATYDVDISGGNVRLLATAASTNSTAYKMMNTLLFS